MTHFDHTTPLTSKTTSAFPKATLSTPPWMPLADLLLARLRQTRGCAAMIDDGLDAWGEPAPSGRLPKPDAFRPRVAPSPIPPVIGPTVEAPPDVLAELDAALLAAADDAEALLDQIAPPGNAASSNASDASFLPTKDILLTLRLAAAFGSNDAFDTIFRPGAVTLLGGLDPQETQDLSRLLADDLLPPGWSSSHSRHRRGQMLRLLAPIIDDGAVRRQSDTRLWSDVEAHLDEPEPMLLLLPIGIRPPTSLAAELPRPILLPPVNRALLRRLLCERFTDGQRSWDALAPEDLPDDAALASVSSTALRLAFRAPTARAALQRLTRSNEKPTGPRLEEMTGKNPALSQARRLVCDLRAWQRGEVAWAEMTRSLLLYGAPGTGKTWLAKAIGGSAGVAFVQGSFAEWQSKGHLGDMLAAMRATFAEAALRAPSVLFIDEIDSAGSRYDMDRSNRGYQRNVINGFLQEIDALAQAEGVLLVGACNQPNLLDPAILRPGRFDTIAEVPLPDAAAITGILRLAFGEETDLLPLARRLVGLSAAEIDARIRSGRSLGRSIRKVFDATAFLTAMEHESCGQDDMLFRIAVHEAGHAIVAHLLGLGRIESVRISPAGGEVRRRETNGVLMRKDIEDTLALHMSGRAAEKIVFKDVSSGSGGNAESDLAQATALALFFERQSGLGGSGLPWQAVPENGLPPDDPALDRIHRHLSKAEQAAKALLQPHLALLHDLATHLVEMRELDAEGLGPWFAHLTDAPTKALSAGFPD